MTGTTSIIDNSTTLKAVGGGGASSAPHAAGDDRHLSQYVYLVLYRDRTSGGRGASRALYSTILVEVVRRPSRLEVGFENIGPTLRPKNSKLRCYKAASATQLCRVCTTGMCPTGCHAITPWPHQSLVPVAGDACGSSQT